MNDPETASWYVAATAPSQESKCGERLGHHGYAIWVPSFKGWVKRGHKRAFVERMLFPGYVFTVVQQGQGFPHRREIPELMGLVGCRGAPIKVPDLVISELRRRIESGEFSPKRRPILAPGAMVRIFEGVMAGHEGVVENANETRARLLVQLFGHSTFVNIPVADLTLI